MWQYSPMPTGTGPQLLTVVTNVWFQWIKWYDCLKIWAQDGDVNSPVLICTYARLPVLFQGCSQLRSVLKCYWVCNPLRTGKNGGSPYRFLNSIAFWEVPMFRSLVLRVRGTCRWGWSVERWRNDSGGKPKYSERSLTHWHPLYHKSHMDWAGTEPGLSRWEAGDQQPDSSFRTAQWTHRLLLKTAKQIMLCREIIAVCTESIQKT